MERWFDARAEQVRSARRWVAEALTKLGCDRDSVGRCELLTSELFTNVVDHTRSDRVGLSVSFDDSTAHIEVIDFDPSTGTPEVAALDAKGARGRGLRIVEALALRWGFEDRGDRRAVWVDVRCTG